MDYIYRKVDDYGIFYAWFEAMHTRIDLIMWDLGLKESDFCQISDKAKKEILRIEMFANCFNHESELSVINGTAVNKWTDVSKELCDILSNCISYYSQSGGLFDIAADMRLKGVHINEKYEVDMDNSRVRRLHEFTCLNLSGFIKGYALSSVIRQIIPSGLKNGMLSLGNSSIYCMGNHPHGEGWLVSNSSEPDKKILLRDECLTTSGNFSDNRKHIINPITGNFVLGKHEISVITQDPEYGEVKSIVEFIKKFS